MVSQFLRPHTSLFSSDPCHPLRPARARALDRLPTKPVSRPCRLAGDSTPPAPVRPSGACLPLLTIYPSSGAPAAGGSTAKKVGRVGTMARSGPRRIAHDPHIGALASHVMPPLRLAHKRRHRGGRAPHQVPEFAVSDQPRGLWPALVTRAGRHCHRHHPAPLPDPSECENACAEPSHVTNSPCLSRCLASAGWSCGRSVLLGASCATPLPS